jgi:TrmH family RNA methyltransferase
MLSKAEVKIIASLKLKKNRQETGLFVAEGEKTVEEALLAGWTCEKLLIRDGYFDKIKAGSVLLQQAPMLVTEESMERMTQLSSASPVLGVFKQQELPWTWQPGDANFVLLLDQLRDPGNLGTIIRTADWFGLAGVFCSEETVALWNSKTIQASMGSIFRVPVKYGDPMAFVEKLPHEQLYATVLDGDDLRGTRAGSGGVVMIGSESFGLSASLQNLAGYQLSIPSFGKAESLNAAVATGIVCAWLRY